MVLVINLEGKKIIKKINLIEKNSKSWTVYNSNMQKSVFLSIIL